MGSKYSSYFNHSKTNTFHTWYYDQGIFRGSFHIVCILASILNLIGDLAVAEWLSCINIIFSEPLMRTSLFINFVCLSGFIILCSIDETSFFFRTFPQIFQWLKNRFWKLFCFSEVWVQPKSRFANRLDCINALIHSLQWRSWMQSKFVDCHTRESFTDCNL